MLNKKVKKYNAMISSDWNQCLSPGAPFDLMSFLYPDLKTEFDDIFDQYTGNKITFKTVSDRVKKMLPQPISKKQMENFIEQNFSIYKGVTELIKWCGKNSVFFMVNTTAAIGWFQILLEKQLIPPIDALSANTMTIFPKSETDPLYIYDLLEIDDKGKNTVAAAKEIDLPLSKICIMGDSGGDGPHFKWGAKAGAFLIGSMTKPSLESYCQKEGITIDARIGESNLKNRDIKKDMETDFTDIIPFIESIIND